ncbi:MAG: hypothetical protein ABSF59_16095 [Candidatus Sulfotelmatobacter sp.]
MKRGMGFFALLAVLVAGTRLASRPSKTANSAGDNLQHLPNTIELTDTDCSAFIDVGDAKGLVTRGSIKTLVGQYLYGNSANPKSTSGSQERTLPPGIQFIVATLPDPLHTHLNLQFDRTIEAIQQAAQDEGYTYDSSWLPWKQRTEVYSTRGDETDEDKETLQRENCPGLILFRKTTQLSAAQPSTENSSEELYDLPYDKGLFVFLVAEKPTTGLNRIQWDNTLGWMDKNGNSTSRGQGVRILGPTFSGSVPSMVRAVIDGNKKYPATFANVLLYTGTIRGCSAYARLKEELSKPGPPLVRTEDFQENDAIQIDRYFKYLTDRGHALTEVAILSEDETAYGGLPDHPPDVAHPQSTCDPGYDAINRPLHLYYPRDISALRSAYEEQSIFAASDSSNSSHQVLQPQAARSTHHDTDTVATFSGVNSALAQEAQMYGVVDSLRTHGIRFVILRSTSSLDQLFLTRFLHHSYADALIVTMGTDMLFGREVDSTEFRGVVALTSFPLLPRGQDWSAVVEKAKRHAHRVFGSNSMEGSYLAARFLINDPPADICQAQFGSKPPQYQHCFKPNIQDYAPPFWAFDTCRPSDPLTPSTWLAVVGRDGYWPLAVLKEPYKNPHPDPNDKSPTSHLISNLALVQAPARSDTIKLSNNRPLSLSVAWKLVCEWAVFSMLVHAFACCRGWKYQNLSALIQFQPAPGSRQLTLITFGWGVLVTALVLMFRSAACITRFLSCQDSAWIWILTALASLGCVAAAFDIYRRLFVIPKPAPASSTQQTANPPQPTSRETREESERADRESARLLRHTRPKHYWIAFPFLLLVLAVWAGWSMFNHSDPNVVPTAFRAVHLTSGLSPMVSLLVMLAGVYWWFWFTLSGLALLGPGRPLLPRLRGSFARIGDEMARNIEGFAMPFPSPVGEKRIFYVFPLLFLGLQYWILHRSSADGLDLMLHSLESASFDRTLQVIFAIALGLLIIESAQLLSTWLALKRLLLALNRTPLRRTFRALQGLSMHSLWTASGTTSRSRYMIFSHQLEAMSHLRNVVQSLDALGHGSKKISAYLDRARDEAKEFLESLSKTEGVECAENPVPGADLAMINNRQSRRLRKKFRLCTEQVFQELILRWRDEKKSLDLTETGAKAGADQDLPLADNEVTRRAEEFVCLSYVGYLQNLLGRMRTMALSILGLFAAIAFSLAFYPYTPRPAIVLCLLALLLIVGSVVGLVYAGLARDETVSHITNTEPGALGWDFWTRIAGFIGVPLIGLVAAQFPGITDFLVSWIQPGLNAAK